MKCSVWIALVAVMASLSFAQNSAQAILFNVDSVRITQNISQHLSLAEVQLFEHNTGTNVALAGTASQTNTRPAGGAASRAIDGNTNGVFSGNSVTHTQFPTAGNSWEVTLASVATIDTLTIFGRTDSCCRGRDDNLTVEFLNANGDVLFTEANFALLPNSGQGTFSINPHIPEPTTAALGLMGLAGLLVRRRRAA